MESHQKCSVYQPGNSNCDICLSGKKKWKLVPWDIHLVGESPEGDHPEPMVLM